MNSSKCARCNRTITNITTVEGKDYGPICVVKLYGRAYQPAAGKSTKQLVKDEPNPDQLTIFTEAE